MLCIIYLKYGLTSCFRWPYNFHYKHYRKFVVKIAAASSKWRNNLPLQGILHSALHDQYWRLIDPQGKPTGVMGWWPSRACTFLENHDTGSTQVLPISLIEVHIYIAYAVHKLGAVPFFWESHRCTFVNTLILKLKGTFKILWFHVSLWGLKYYLFSFLVQFRA